MPLTNTFNPSTAVNTGTDTITINAHGFLDRQGVLYHSGGGTAIGGLVDGYKYYVIVVTLNSIKLALTEDDAITSTAIDLLSVGSGTTHSFESTNIYPNSAAYYDFFRKVRLLGNGTPATGYKLEADSVRDSLTIVAGANIVFENTNEDQDTFTISGSEYDFDVPVGSTELRLYGRVGSTITDDQSIRFSVDRGINITRISDTELRFEGLGVTETDTLHSVTERGALTSNTIYVNNLEVGIIQSIPGEDGITNFTTTGTTGSPINVTGDGTLDSPGEIDLASTTEASKTVQINFTTPVAGTLTYSASYKAESALTTGSVILQRETPGSPGTWVTIDSASGTTARYAYTIQNIYAEPNNGATNFRIITTWTGLTTGYVDFPINLQFEISPIYINEMIRTDTSAGELHLGRIDGEVYLRGDINIRDRINTDGLYIYQNVIQGTNSNDDIIIDPAGTGGVELRTQTLNTDQTTFNLIDNIATTVNVFGSATAINMGANTGTITIENPTLVGTVATQNLYDTTATTVNAFGDAATINIGDNTGTITVRNPTLVGVETTQNVYNTVATTVNAFGAAATLNIGENSGTLTLRNPTVVGTQTTQNVYDTVATTVNAFGAATTIDVGATTGTITINNPTLVGTQTTQNVYDTIATTVNAFGAATTIDIGANTGTITINNPTLVGTETTQNVYNSVATTVNFAGAATTLEIGAATGTTNVNNNLVVDLDLQVKGGDITTDQTTFNLLNATATTINAFGAATTANIATAGTTIEIGAATGTTNVNNNLVVDLDLEVKGGDLTTNQTSFNLLNATATTVNAFGAATTISIGSATGTTTVNNSLTVTGDLIVNGTTTTLNTTTLDVEDLNITVANGAANAAAANGAGLTVEGPTTPATLTYASADDSWNLNKLLNGTSANFTGNLQVDGNLTFGSDDTDSITANAFFVNSTQLKSAKANTNTLSLAAYDVDGTVYANLITLTASNTPTLALTSIGVGTINNINIGTTTRATANFTTLDANSTVGLSPANAAVTISPTGTGTVTINPATTGTIDNTSIGVTTAASGRFTTLTASALTTLQQTTEVLNTKTGATGTVVHDISTGSIWYHSSLSANFTANFTNVPTTNNRSITVALILDQGATARIPNAVQIDGAAQTIQWASGSIPSGTNNYTDIVNFTLIRVSSAWTVLGSLSTFN